MKYDAGHPSNRLVPHVVQFFFLSFVCLFVFVLLFVLFIRGLLFVLLCPVLKSERLFELFYRCSGRSCYAFHFISQSFFATWSIPRHLTQRMLNTIVDAIP